MQGNRKILIMVAVACAMAIAPAVVKGDMADDLIADVESVAVTESPAKAIAMLKESLASNRHGAAAAAKLNSRLATLLASNGKAAESATVMLDTLAATGAPASLILAPAREYVESPSEKSLFIKQRTCQALLDSSSFAEKEAERADMLCLLASIYARRSFCDLEFAALKEAAACRGGGDPERDARMLEALAENAIARDDKALARTCYEKLCKLPGLHYSRARRAQLAEGRSYIQSRRFRWVPTTEDLQAAEKTIKEAIEAKPRSVSSDEAFAALADVMDAYSRIGLSDKALELALDLSEYSPEQVSPPQIASVMFKAAEIYASREDWRNSQKFYKKAQDSGYKAKKVLCYKLATAARRNGDITSAMQALTDAIACCDPIEGKKEIESLRRQIGNLSRTIRDKVRETSAEDLFINESDDIMSLELDEE